MERRVKARLRAGFYAPEDAAALRGLLAVARAASLAEADLGTMPPNPPTVASIRRALRRPLIALERVP
jgi:hypothetical protein